MEKILVIRGGALGDFLVTLPACMALRGRWPGARIECLGYRAAELGHGRGYFDAVRSLERGSLAGFFADGLILDPEWGDWFSEFDLVVSWLYDPAGVFAENLKRCGVPEVIAADPQVPATLGAPAARHFFEALPFARGAGEGVDLRSRLFPTAADREAAAAFLGPDAPPFVAVHPGSGSPTKNWPLENWAALLEKFRAEGRAVLLVGGEADGPAIEKLRPLARWTAFHRPLPELAALLARATAFVGHDSGISHLASAAGAPVTALFGPTDPTVWAPPGATVLRGGEGWAELDVARVFAALDR
jgi:heptosyltransferase-2